MTAGKQLDPEQAFAVAMGQSPEKAEKAEKSNGLRLRIKEHNLIRRRKVSVPELGPMTTVQEVAMDSRKFLQVPSTYICKQPSNTIQQLFPAALHYTKGPSARPSATGANTALPSPCLRFWILQTRMLT